MNLINSRPRDGCTASITRAATPTAIFIAGDTAATAAATVFAPYSRVRLWPVRQDRRSRRARRACARRLALPPPLRCHDTRYRRARSHRAQAHAPTDPRVPLSTPDALVAAVAAQQPGVRGAREPHASASSAEAGTRALPSQQPPRSPTRRRPEGPTLPGTPLQSPCTPCEAQPFRTAPPTASAAPSAVLHLPILLNARPPLATPALNRRCCDGARGTGRGRSGD
eukprot:6175708-Pleurochrysis_carterae.AAC.4